MSGHCDNKTLILLIHNELEWSLLYLQNEYFILGHDNLYNNFFIHSFMVFFMAYKLLLTQAILYYFCSTMHMINFL